MHRKSFLLATILSVSVLALVGCGGAAPAPATTAPPAVPATATTAPTSVPAVTATTAAPTNAAPATSAPTSAPAATNAPSATTAATSAPTAAGATATTAAAAPTSAPAAGGPVPNCAGGNCTQPGAAITQNLTGNATNGAQLYVTDCKKCHGTDGKGGINNPGSADGTIPPLNPIDPEFKNGNFKLNVDLFIEHGSQPEGANVLNVMDAWGDKGKLSPQQIADLIAYILSLNP